MEVINNLCQATQRILGSCFRSTLNRFASADTIVPDPANPQSFNRYSYSFNNPINYVDPDGHDPHWCNGDPICINSYTATTMSINKKSNWENLPLTDSEEFSSWNEGKHSGCTMCHAAAGTPFTVLTNDELEASLDQMHQAAFEGAVAMGVGTMGGLSLGMLAEAASAACIDGDCTNEVRAVDPNKLEHIFGNAGHNLDQFVKSFGGNQQAAFEALKIEFNNVASSYTISQLNQGIQVTVNNFDITVRGTIVDGVARIGTAYIP